MRVFSDIMPNENIFVKVIDSNKKIINASNEFDYNLKISKPYGKARHIESQERHLTYLNAKTFG